MSENIRCFIAIELSGEIRDALAEIEESLKANIPGVKWVRPENMHLTLKFLGHISPSAAEHVKSFLSEIASQVKPFPIRLSAPGVFPSLARPRVIWAGIDKGSKESIDLAERIEEKAALLGIEKETRPFHPHLTLARVDFSIDKEVLNNAFARIKVPNTEMTASKITLFQSTLRREGPIYTVLHEALF